MKCPADVYSVSPKPYQGLPALNYPLHDRNVLVIACGRICMHRKRINISTPVAGRRLGIKEFDDGIWFASLIHFVRSTRSALIFRLSGEACPMIS